MYVRFGFRNVVRVCVMFICWCMLCACVCVCVCTCVYVLCIYSYDLRACVYHVCMCADDALHVGVCFVCA